MNTIYRLKYAKTEAGRYLSHLDILRAWQKVFRRARLPLAYSKGFNPHPLISFGSVLPVGITGSGEYLDLELEEGPATEELATKIAAMLPPALELVEIAKLAEKSKALMSLLNRAAYTATCDGLGLNDSELQKIIEEILAREEIIVKRKAKRSRKRRSEDKEINIRSGIYALEARTEGEQVIVQMTLRIGDGGNIRPHEVLDLLKGAGAIEPEGEKVNRDNVSIA